MLVAEQQVLFNPEIIGLEYPGVAQTLCLSIQKSDLDIRKTLYSHIVLSGGSTMFRGFGARLLDEVKQLAPPQELKIRIQAPPARKVSTWIGASILASLSTFKRSVAASSHAPPPPPLPLERSLIRRAASRSAQPRRTCPPAQRAPSPCCQLIASGT